MHMHGSVSLRAETRWKGTIYCYSYILDESRKLWIIGKVRYDIFILLNCICHKNTQHSRPIKRAPRRAAFINRKLFISTHIREIHVHACLYHCLYIHYFTLCRSDQNLLLQMNWCDAWSTDWTENPIQLHFCRHHIVLESLMGKASEMRWSKRKAPESLAFYIIFGFN